MNFAPTVLAAFDTVITSVTARSPHWVHVPPKGDSYAGRHQPASCIVGCIRLACMSGREVIRFDDELLLGCGIEGAGKASPIFVLFD